MVRMSNHTESPTLPPPGKITGTPLGAISPNSTRISVSPGAFTAGSDASPVPNRTDRFEAPVGNSNSPIGSSWRRHTTSPLTGAPDPPPAPIGRLYPAASSAMINRADTPPYFDHCDDVTTTPCNAETPSTGVPKYEIVPSPFSTSTRSGSPRQTGETNPSKTGTLPDPATMSGFVNWFVTVPSTVVRVDVDSLGVPVHAYWVGSAHRSPRPTTARAPK